MGHYSYLKVGSISLAWKYTIPTFVTFLFSEDELKYDEDKKEGFITEYYFLTEVFKALRRLDEVGYNANFIDNLYGFF